MRRAIGATVGALLFLFLAPSVVAGKKTVPPQVVQAQHVALGYDLAGSSYNTSDASNVDDVMVVYDCAEGRVGKRLWHASQTDGLAGAAPVLVTKFRGDVERTPPAAAASEPAKPSK